MFGFHDQNEVGAAGYFAGDLARAVGADFDPYFGHGRYGSVVGLVAMKCVGPGRSHFDVLLELVRQKMAKQTLCHGAAANIAGAYHEYSI